MDISIILATFKRPDLLDQTLYNFCSLITEGLKWEVLIVDNANDRKTGEVAGKYVKSIPVKYLVETRQGKNNALNRAVPEAQGDIFVFTDDDIIAEPEWLQEIWEGSKRWPEYYIFGGKCLPRFPRDHGLTYNDNEFFENAFTIANWNIPEGCYNADRVYGPNMAIRASVFRDGWRFNPNIGPDGTSNYLMGSETELTTRLEQAGYRAVYLPRSIVYHQVRDEQLTSEWLYKRAFRAGREMVYFESRQKQTAVTGIPRHLISRLFKACVKILLSRISKNSNLKFEYKIFYCQTKGMTYQYLKQISGKYI